jgi:hypothetical protein
VTATKRAVAMATRVVSKDEGNGDGDKEGNCNEEGTMASNDDNKMMATETRTMTTMTMVTNITTKMKSLTTTMAKTTTKTRITMVQQQGLEVAGGSGRRQQSQQWRGLSVHIFN